MFHPMSARSAASADELLSFSQIAAEGGAAVQTQYIWASTGRYGYNKLIVKVGRLSRIPRSKYREWLSQRSVAQEKAA